MKVHYGYVDGTGEYFIEIDTAFCLQCKKKPCINACPKGVYKEEEDDFGDASVTVVKEARKNLMYLCMECKSDGKERKRLPCVSHCPFNALKHSW